jgi:amidase
MSRGLGESHADCVAAVAATAALLEELGHDVAPDDFAPLDDPGFHEAIPVLFPVFIARELDRWSERLGRTIAPSELEPWNALQAEVGAATTGPQYVQGIERAHRYGRGLASWWADGHDLLLTPMITEPPFLLGELGGPSVDPMAAFVRLGGLTSFTMPFNVSGQPAISLPLHWSDDGLPIGVQLVAAYGRDDLLLRVAAQLEEARPWASRRPESTVAP